MFRIYRNKFYGVVGVIFYFILSLPFIRSVLFGEKPKILDSFNGEVVGDGDIVRYVGQLILFIPYTLNVHVFSMFDFNNMNILVLILMTPIVYRYFSFSNCWTNFFILLFLFFPAPLLFLSTFTKETILVVCLFFSYGYYKNLNSRSDPIYFSVYAVVMRPYLFWVPLVIKSKNIGRALMCVLVLFILLLQFELTSEIVYRILNRRLVETLYIANSKLVQTVVVRDSYDIVSMMLEVFPQIFTPILFGISMKSIVFQIYILFLMYICTVKRNPYSNVILILMVMYAVLDPDLGAYFRHLSSFFIFFPLILGLEKGVKSDNLEFR